MTTPREALDAAVISGIVTHEQADKLILFLAPYFPAPQASAIPASAAAEPPADPDEEEVRFVRGFQDIFLTIGIAILLVGLGIGLPMVIGPIAGLFACALISWLLAEFFARSRKLVLPSIALSIGLTLFLSAGIIAAMTGYGWEKMFGDYSEELPLRVAISAALGGLVAALIFFARFRLPFALLLVAGCATTAALVALEMVWPGIVKEHWLALLLGAGTISFLAAMAFDISDPLRRTLRADNAFWLHLFAAPLIVHSVVALVIQRDRTEFSVEDAGIIIAMVLAFAFVALVIDRRALLVAALGYLGFAIGALMQQSQLSVTGMVAATLVMLGAFVVALGAGWKPARSLLLGWPPSSGFVRYLPPVRPV
jgi:hypothetical protein